MKKTRGYDSSRRQEGAEKTKERVLAAARRLFSSRGVDDVTLDEIARAARVATSTLYARFRSKTGILRALMEDVILSARFRSMSETLRPDMAPAELLRLTARIARTVYDDEAREMGLMRGASIVSRDLKQLEREFEDIRFELQRQRVEWLCERGALRDELDLLAARELLWMLTGRDTYRMLVVERGWSGDRFERWLAETLIQQLLRPTIRT